LNTASPKHRFFLPKVWKTITPFPHRQAVLYIHHAAALPAPANT
jgi:hypothetical protein